MSTTATTLKGQPLNKAVLDALLRRRMFFTPSFEVNTISLDIPLVKFEQEPIILFKNT